MKKKVGIILLILAIAAVSFAKSEDTKKVSKAAGKAVTKSASAEKNKTKTKVSTKNAATHVNSGVNKKVSGTPTDGRTSSDIVQAQMENYIVKTGLRSNSDNQVYMGTETVLFSSDSQYYAQAKQIAYEKATMKAMRDFVMSNWAQTASKRIMETYNNDSSNSTDIPNQKPVKGSTGSILKKMDMLVGAKLDSALKKENVNPDKIDKDPEVKKLLASDKFYTDTITTAYGQLVGLMPIKTFYVEKNGKGCVGVIMRYSPITRAISQELSNGQLPSFRGKGGESVNSFVNEPTKTLETEFGIRLIIDEKGQPAIIAYGQSGYEKQLDDNITSIKEDAAKQNAENSARSALAFFINSTLSNESHSKTGTEVSQSIVKNLQTNVSKQSSDEQLLNIMTSSATAEAETDLQGVRVMRTWSIPNSTNPKLVTQGVVLVWSFGSYKSTQAINDFQLDDSDASNSDDNTSSSGSKKEISEQSPDNKYLNQF